MNSLQFQFCRIGRIFGIRRDRQRMAAMTRETQFLHEAVELLGRAAWQDTQSIDDLAVEFWQIKDVEKQQVDLRESMESIREDNTRLENERVEIESRFNEEINGLKEDKIDHMSDALELMRDNDTQKAELERVKRRYAGMKLRLKAVAEEHGDGVGLDANSLNSSMEELKANYSGIQQEIDGRAKTIKENEATIASIDLNLGEKRQAMKTATSDIVSKIGKGSKQLADISAKIGSLQNSKNALANRIGRFLSQNIENPSQEIRSVLSKHRALTSKIRYFRQSIGYFQRLVRN